jgi:hypothetical protein
MSVAVQSPGPVIETVPASGRSADSRRPASSSTVITSRSARPSNSRAFARK